MDNFREWLSDNLRYILLGAGVLVIIAGLFFGVRACSSAMKGDAAEVVDESTENNKGNDPSSPENSGESDEKNENANPIEKNKYPKVNALIQKYYDAVRNKDVDTIRTVVDELDPTEEAKVTNAKYIDGYENLEVYTKKGIDSGDYVVYAQYDYVCTGIDTPVPALSQLYVKTESAVALKIYSKAEEAEKAQASARALFSQGAAAQMPTTELTEEDMEDGCIDILTMLVKSGLVPSKSEARRAVQQGGVSVDGEKVENIHEVFTEDAFKAGIVLKKGKKNFRKIVMK